MGDVDIELWSKETPIACRNFVQLCMEGYYNQCTFHTIIKDCIVQTGDPSGTGEGGKSIFEKDFKIESHQRLRFNRRGLVAMAANPDGFNGSQFFITLGATHELNGKHTLFGKVVENFIDLMIHNGFRLPATQFSIFWGLTKRKWTQKTNRLEVRRSPACELFPIHSTTLYLVVCLMRNQKRKAKRIVMLNKRIRNQRTKTRDFLSFGDEMEEEEEIINNVSKVNTHLYDQILTLYL
ncbi:hypothetical protein M3Y94_01159200 [Aphelenchoides besseyi]|nr:hypothetical protein M3Y94_01159200 [Aphelenchoides besseyi]